MILQDGMLIQCPQSQGAVFLTSERPQDKVERHFPPSQPPPPQLVEEGFLLPFTGEKTAPSVERPEERASTRVTSLSAPFPSPGV